jgi:carboxyl-terminal processing protease
MRLLRWDGEAPETLWAQRLATSRESSTPQARELMALRQWMDGTAGSRVALRWARPEGGEWDLSLARETRVVPSTATLTRLTSGVSVLRWNRFDTAVEADLKRAMREASKTPGLVLDLRGNGGGSFDMTKRLIDAVLPVRADVHVTHRREGRERTVHRVGGTPLYAGPLVVLVDRGSASGAEMLASSLQALGRAKVVGETSCGCLLGIFRYIPLAANARLAVSEQALALPDGRRIEAVGVQPDVPVARSLAALREGRDEALTAAEYVLLAAPAPNIAP